MSRTYQTEGIILKAMAMGEADRLVTVLTPDRGLIKVIAPGARKSKSKLSGSTALFVQSQLMCLQGRSLDKLLQVSVLHSHSSLSQHLAKLTTAQYWAELTLFQSIEGTSNPQLYQLFLALLKKLEDCDAPQVYQLLVQGMSLLLHHAGITPQLDCCCRTQVTLEPEMMERQPGIFFSFEDGGVICGESQGFEHEPKNNLLGNAKTVYTEDTRTLKNNDKPYRGRALRTIHRLTLAHWFILTVITPDSRFTPSQINVFEDFGTYHWFAVEKLLRGYAQHHFERTIRSATLINAVFQP